MTDKQKLPLTEPQPDVPFDPEYPRGDLLRATAEFVDTYGKAQPIWIKDPNTGTEALFVLNRDGTLMDVGAANFDDYRERPRFRHGTANMLSLQSFIDHVNRFHSAHSAIFANDNRERPSLTAVLDYHPAGDASDPAFGQHRTTFAFPLSDEWKAWQAQNKKAMSMTDFAEFLEDRIVDVIPPSDGLSEEQERMVQTLGGRERIATPTSLIELSRGLHVYENSLVKEAVKLSSGEGEITFEAQHTDAQGRPLIVPTSFLLAIPVFRNDAPYQVLARLRYRKTPNGLVFFYELWRTDRVFDHAFNEAAQKAADETGAPLFLGSPEA